MRPGFLSQNIKISRGLAYASGTADRNGAILDMAGWDGLLIIAIFATIATGGVNSIKVQQGSAANLSDAADLPDTEIDIADNDDNCVRYIDVYQPRERYLRAVIDKDTSNACAESVLYIRYRGLQQPVTAHGLVTEGVAVLSPGETSSSSAVIGSTTAPGSAPDEG